MEDKLVPKGRWPSGDELKVIPKGETVVPWLPQGWITRNEPSPELTKWLQSCPPAQTAVLQQMFTDLVWLNAEQSCKECGEAFPRSALRRNTSSAYEESAADLVCRSCFELWTDGTLIPIPPEKWDDQPLPVHGIYEVDDTHIVESGKVYSRLDCSEIGTFRRLNTKTRMAHVRLDYYPVRDDQCLAVGAEEEYGSVLNDAYYLVSGKRSFWFGKPYEELKQGEKEPTTASTSAIMPPDSASTSVIVPGTMVKTSATVPFAIAPADSASVSATAPFAIAPADSVSVSATAPTTSASTFAIAPTDSASVSATALTTSASVSATAQTAAVSAATATASTSPSSTRSASYAALRQITSLLQLHATAPTTSASVSAAAPTTSASTSATAPTAKANSGQNRHEKTPAVKKKRRMPCVDEEVCSDGSDEE